MEEVGKAMGPAYGAIMQVVESTGAQVIGSPFCIWYEWENKILEFDNAIPIDRKIKGTKDVLPIKTYQGNVAFVSHMGEYSTTSFSWVALEDYIMENNLEMNGAPYEVYITDPETEPNPANWITELYWPIK
jgi:AraC family transcriptional regulator